MTSYPFGCGATVLLCAMLQLFYYVPCYVHGVILLTQCPLSLLTQCPLSLLTQCPFARAQVFPRAAPSSPSPPHPCTVHHMCEIKTSLPFSKRCQKSGFELCFAPSTVRCWCATHVSIPQYKRFDLISFMFVFLDTSHLCMASTAQIITSLPPFSK